MKKAIFYLVAVLWSTFIFGQTIYKGKVVDSQQNPIAYADVVALNTANNEFIDGVITDNQGTFELKVNTPNPHYLEISFIGYETKKLNPTQAEIGIITLQEQATELNEIVITARKNLIEQKTDRLVFNVENTVAATNGTALDLLKATPSVQVNNQGINIVGKSGVRVLVNDRMVQLSGEELVNYLSSFASDDIKNIEVITTPPAKYDAEGNGGLINIVLKKPRENSWNNQIRTSYTQTSYPAVKLGNTFNYSHKNWKIFTSVDGSKGHAQDLIQMNIHYPNELWKDTLKGKSAKDYITAKLGMDYQLSPQSSIGFFYSGAYKQPNIEEKGKTSIFDKNQQTIGKIKNDGFTDVTSYNNSLNLHYLQALDTLGRSLSIDLDYFNYQNDKDRTFQTQQIGLINHLQKTRNTGLQDISNYSAKIDIEHPTQSMDFSYGGKITRTKTDNSVHFYDITSGNPILDPNKSSIFEYTEDIQALYIDANKSFSEQWQAKAGLRAEFTQSKGFSKDLNQTHKRKYVQWFPTVFVNYIKNEDHMFNLSFNRRIDRPSFSQLNPFQFYINANSYVEGNPDLQPNFSNELQFKYIYRGSYITEVFYQYVEDISTQVPKVNVSKNQQYYTFQNIGNLTVFGLSQTILYNPFNWWNTTNMFAVFHQQTETKVDLGTDTFFNGWKVQAYSNQSFMLNSEGTLQAEATIFAQSRGYEFLYDVDPFWKLDIGLKAQFSDRKLQVSAKLNDVFKTSSPNLTTYTNNTQQVYNIYNDNRYFTLGLSYKFGNNKIRVQQHNQGNEEEKNRVD